MGSRAQIEGLLACKEFISCNRRYEGTRLSDEYLSELDCLQISLENSKIARGCMSDAESVTISLEFYLKSRKDTDNVVKTPVDKISSYLGFDDSIVQEVIAKRHMMRDTGGLEYVYFKVEQLEPEEEISEEEFTSLMEERISNETYRKLSNKIAGKRGE